eukprot:m.9957 g.9957  ORF g.9957 m.9957 type:complete len:678 (+) comp7107_c0_seq1:87-2120(+)
MADSWEDEYDEQQAQGQAGAAAPQMNAQASAFVPNLNAAAFVPSFGGAQYGTPQQGYGAYGVQPQYTGYQQQYQPQQQGYQNPQHAYQAPQHSYQAPQHSYAAPQQSNQASNAPAQESHQSKREPPKSSPAEPSTKAESKPEAPKKNTSGGNTKSSTEPSTLKETKTEDVPKVTRDKSGGDNTKSKSEDTTTKSKGAENSSGGTDSSDKSAKDEKKEKTSSAKDDDDFIKGSDSSVDFEVLDKREHVNIIFIGHVDAGKSTIGGHLMFLTGGVDKRTLEKYEREAKEKNRESWYLSWALDTNDEERAKGKTVECGKAHFTTEKKHFTIIDAPGHKSFVPNMITGAAQADIAILVISTRKGEFEAGFDRGGQTREHAMLAKSVGVKRLVVVFNKMDLNDWQEKRYNACKDKLTPFLKQCGFNLKNDVIMMPVSGQQGTNLISPMPEGLCPWYKGPSLVQFLDELPKIQRHLDLPMRMPVADKYSDMGVYVMGKLISGYCKKGDTFMLMPNRDKVTAAQVLVDEEESETAKSGDNVKIKLKGIEEDAISPGYVLCAIKPCSVTNVLDAQLALIDFQSIMCSGFQCILHIHTAIEEVEIKLLICYMNKKTGKPDKAKGRPRFMKQGDICVVRIAMAGAICAETFKENPGMARFTLRDEGKTIAVGRILKLVSEAEDTKEA